MFRLAVISVFLLFLSGFLAAQPGAHLARDLTYGPAGSFDAPGTGIKCILDSIAIFLASGDSGYEAVCRSSGTKNGTFSLSPSFLPDNANVQDFVVHQGLCWFIMNHTDQPAGALYSTDGTILGTKIRYLKSNGNLGLLRVYNNDLLFKTTDTGQAGDKLLRFDPSNGMITVISGFYPANGLMDMAVAGNTIYAIGEPDSTGRYLMKSDNGAAGSLAKVALINTGSEFNEYIFMTPAGNRVFFFWQQGNDDYKLWVSNGTASGTIPLKAFIPPLFEDLKADKAIVVYNNNLIFRATDAAAVYGQELFRSDGTPAGTFLLKDIVPGENDSRPLGFTPYKGKIWFTAYDPSLNLQLWSTDGAPAGTVPSLASAGFNEIKDPAVFADSLVFGAYRAIEGAELFIMPGTDAGTRALTNQSPVGNGDFDPANLVPAGQKLFFTAVTAATGRELWVYELGTATGVMDISDAPFGIRVFPNPGGDFLRVEAELPCHVTVYAVDGRVMADVVEGTNVVIGTKGWSAGVYGVRVRCSGHVYSTRWTKGRY